MRDRFGRDITYLRISVTDQCNLRCQYCVPTDDVRLLCPEDMLSFKEIVRIVRAATTLGIRKVRLTGGEPLLRPGIEVLVRQISGIPGVTDLAMTTNGSLLAEHARALATAGLHRINISLDTMDSDRYRALTRGGDIQDVLNGIQSAREAGLFPIKLNCVVSESSTEPDALEVGKFGEENGLEVRFINRIDVKKGIFSLVQGGSGGDCPRCDRIRLSCDGWVRPCLLSDLQFSVRKMGEAQALRRAICEKPEAGGPCRYSCMHGIGG
jgi:cyclic pyranopterin phosphate synthase